MSFVTVSLQVYVVDTGLPLWCSGRASALGVGTIPCRVTQKALKMVVMAALLGAQSCRVSIKCQDKWTSRTGNIPRKRHDIMKQLLKAA